jgi:hypothetical protein
MAVYMILMQRPGASPFRKEKKNRVYMYIYTMTTRRGSMSWLLDKGRENWTNLTKCINYKPDHNG